MHRIPILISLFYGFPFVVFAQSFADICPGDSVQLSVSGGEQYFWSPAAGLSCSDCANPVASPDASTLYTVGIVRLGDTTYQQFLIGVYGLQLGDTLTVCNGAEITLNPGGLDFPNAQYAWTGFPPNFSCTDCPSPTVTGLTTGIYLYFGSLTAPGCAFADTLLVRVLGGQSPQYALINDTSICAGANVQLGGAAFPATDYNWTSSPAGFTSSLPNPTVAPTVNTTYYLSATNGSCPIAALDSVTVSVAPDIKLQLPNDTVICQGQTILLNTTPPQENVVYAWTPNDGSIADTTEANPLATVEQDVTYRVTASNGGCTAADSVRITISPINIQLSADTVRICLGDTATVAITELAPAGSTVNWSPLTNIFVGPGGTSARMNPDESRLYTATVLAPGCSRSASVWIQVDSLPSDKGILPQDTSICQGSLVLLTSPAYEPSAFPDIQFRWIPPDGQQTADSLYNLVVQPNDTTIYRRINQNGACIDTSTVTVNVIPTAQMNITPQDTIVCPGETVQLNLTYTPGVTNIMWTPQGGLSCTTCDNPVATVSADGFYSALGEFMGCPVSAAVTLKAFPAPGYAFPTDTKLCEGDTLLLNTINDPNTSYTWTSTAPGFGVQTTATPIWAPNQSSAVFFLDAVTNQGCRVLDTLSAIFSTATLDVEGDTTICRGGTAVIKAITSVPGMLEWNTGQNSPTISVSPNQSTSYTVVFTYAGDCQLVGFATVNVAESPDVQFPPANQRAICLGDMVVLNLNPKPGVAYTWTSDPPGFFSTAQAPAVSPTVPTTYTVTATNGICQEVRSVTITPLVATVNAGMDTTICAGDEITLNAETTGTTGGSFLWTPPGRNGNSITVQPDSTTSYVVTYTYGGMAGCEVTDTVKVTVTPGFDLSIQQMPDNDSVSLGQVISLQAVVKPSQDLSNFKFTWTEVSPDNAVLGMGETIEYVPSANEETQVLITLSAVSPSGCEQLNSVQFLIVQPVVKFPNVFSPNNDGSNDAFRPVETVGEVAVEQLDIYNRWGQKVYTSNDPDAKWDGNVDGNPAPTDVYVYYVKYRRGDGSLLVAHGDVTLLR